uniref:Uncharacterized protein n=1 Tax=Schistosoma haematobium TaxID=6185 RepID=A0A094ZJI7_SCHHA
MITHIITEDIDFSSLNNLINPLEHLFPSCENNVIMELFSYLRLIVVYISLIVYSQTLMKRLQPFVLIITEIVLELHTPVATEITDRKDHVPESSVIG